MVRDSFLGELKYIYYENWWSSPLTPGRKIYRIYRIYHPSHVFCTGYCTFLSLHTLKQKVGLSFKWFALRCWLPRDNHIVSISSLLLCSLLWNDVFGNDLSYSLSKSSIFKQFVKNLDLPMCFHSIHLSNSWPVSVTGKFFAQSLTS